MPVIIQGRNIAIGLLVAAAVGDLSHRHRFISACGDTRKVSLSYLSVVTPERLLCLICLW